MHAKPELLRFCDPRFGVAQTGHFANMCTRYCKASEASAFGRSRPFEAFRGLTHGVSRPSGPPEASTKSQNPFSLQDFEASVTRAYNTIKGVPARPRAQRNPGCRSSFM